ncbi:MAG: histidine--tRNA ligase, partial [Candidatus Diapherotrites archaeon]|nr:histidine--tRNA ligase [Candidatus Diapherotrites archaeon]
MAVENFQTVRGMQDFLPERAAKKQLVEDTCKAVFERYGFDPLETPVVEDFALLSKKGSGGEAIKDEIYYFKDKSGRELGLRFDLTVPLARVVATNKQLAKPFKRFQIGRVYRYDRPQEKRYREFTQADWDIVGSASTLSDFEAIAIAIDVMKELGFTEKDFSVEINNRKLLEEIALSCNVPQNKVVECFRCLDKLDKIGVNEVKKEMQKKGIDTQILGQLQSGGLEKLSLKDNGPLKELEALFIMLEENGLDKYASMNLCLARGLEYYTGMVFEVAVKDSPSVGGGGRYDKLVEMYGGSPNPAVGGSFGIERLVEALGKKLEAGTNTSIFVAAVGEKTQNRAIELTRQVRELD